jgi:hypothetical protein
MGVIVGNWLGQPQTIAGKDSKQPIVHFWVWACEYLVLNCNPWWFPGHHEEWIVHVQGTFTTGTSTTIGTNAAPLYLLLGFGLKQINCQYPPKQFSSYSTDSASK